MHIWRALMLKPKKPFTLMVDLCHFTDFISLVQGNIPYLLYLSRYMLFLKIINACIELR